MVYISEMEVLEFTTSCLLPITNFYGSLDLGGSWAQEKNLSLFAMSPNIL